MGGADGQPFEKRGVQGHTMMTPEPCRLKDCFFCIFLMVDETHHVVMS